MNYYIFLLRQAFVLTFLSSIATAQWTPVAGDQGQNPSVYTSVGPSPPTMGSRASSATWQTADGAMWIFGGQGVGRTRDQVGSLNDMWNFKADTNHWQYIGGPQNVNATGMYGVLGACTSTNWPGARYAATTVTSPINGGLVYMFGGQGFGATPQFGLLNDLWVLQNGPNPCWMWSGGSAQVNMPLNNAVPWPGGRRGAVGFFVDQPFRLYIFGGFGLDNNGNMVPFNDLWKFAFNGPNPILVNATFKVGTQGPTPQPRERAVAYLNTVQKIWYIYGGELAPDKQYADSWALDTTNGNYLWRLVGGSQQINDVGNYPYGPDKKDNLPFYPCSRSGMTVFSDPGGFDDRMYIFGGSFGGQLLNDLWQIRVAPNSVSFNWMAGPHFNEKPANDGCNVPMKRRDALGWKVGDVIRIYGGFVGNLAGDWWSVDAEKIPNDNVQQCYYPSVSNGNNKSNKVDALYFIAIPVALLIAIAVGCFIIRRRRRRTAEAKRKDIELNTQHNEKQPNHASITIDPTPQQNASQSQLSKSSQLAQLVQITDITIGKRLGKGNFGEVYLGTWNNTNVALKKLTSEQSSDIDAFQREAQVLCSLNHPNIVRFFGLHTSQVGQLYMVMELVSRGSLKDVLREDKQKISLNDMLDMMISAAKGMVYLESKNVLHRDLSARNLLVLKVDDKYEIKISDFGMSRNTSQYSSVGKLLPVRWCAPEVLKGKDATLKSDVFSFGVVMWEIIELGETPWPNIRRNEDVSDTVIRGDRQSRPDSCPENLYAIMLQCWEDDPIHRPSFTQVLDLLNGFRKIEVNEDKVLDDTVTASEYSSTNIYQAKPYQTTVADYQSNP